MKRDEFKNYAASLRDKSAKFKKLKGELSEIRHEVYTPLSVAHTLTRTLCRSLSLSL